MSVAGAAEKYTEVEAAPRTVPRIEVAGEHYTTANHTPLMEMLHRGLLAV